MCVCAQSPQAHGKSSHLVSPWTVPQLLITVALCPLPISTSCLNLPWCACCQAVSQKASDLMASASPQRCYPQLVVKFKSATQKALCSFTRANELNQEEGHSSKYSVKEHFYRGFPFAQRSRGPPLTCEQSRQADLQPRLQVSTLTLRHTGGRASLPDCLTLPPLTNCPQGWTFHFRVLLVGVNKNTYLSVLQMAKTESGSNAPWQPIK